MENYVARLNEFAQRKRFIVHYEEIESAGPDHIKTFTLRAVLKGKAYPEGVGRTKKEAKQHAAKNALNCLLKDSADSTADETSNQQTEKLNGNVLDICNEVRSLSLSSNNSFTKTNYIGFVNHYCQKKGFSPDYTLVERCGPPHNPRFFYKLEINNKHYPLGEGKSAKEAKQNAARLAWSALQAQSDWDSKVSVRSTASEDGATSMLTARSTTLESNESSLQSTSMSSSDSIIFANSSHPSMAQIPFRSTMSEDDSSTRESLASSQSMPDITSSGIFTDLSSSSEDQHAVEDNNMRSRQNETQSWFKSEFDSIEHLGSGGFGCVYKARHKLLDKYYAVKKVRWEEKSLREVGTLSDLHHDNIVRYYTFWIEDSGNQLNASAGSSQSAGNSLRKRLYIQMELCDTKTLGVWIDEKNRQSLQESKRREEGLSIAQQIVTGVEYIHCKKQIHRDLKPANILFGLDGKVKIGDFGLVTRDDTMIERTVDKGTPLYMAPEQVTMNAYNRKVDIFPLGLIYLELLWKVSTIHERVKVLQDARNQTFPKGFSVTFPLEKQLIKSMLCQEPEGRPEASALKAELEKFAQLFHAPKLRQDNVTV